MKTNGISSQFKQSLEQANVAFGKAQAVREAVDYGGIGNGVCEGISQFCSGKSNFLAQSLVRIKDSSIGRYIIKNMFNIQFGEGGDTIELNSEKLSKVTGQDGKLGGLLIKLIDGKSGWLSKLTSNICNKSSKFVSDFLYKITGHIANEDIRDGIRKILSQTDNLGSKARQRKINKEAQQKECIRIEQKIKENDDISLDNVKEMIDDCEVKLNSDFKDKIYLSWAEHHQKCGDGDKRKLFDSLSITEQRNLGFNDDLTGENKGNSRMKAIQTLFSNKTTT